MTVPPEYTPEEPEFPPDQPISTPSSLAPWGTRALGYLIDVAPVIIIQLLVFRSSLLSTLVGIGVFLYSYVYLGYLDGFTGQTPGKAIMGTRVVNFEGATIGTGAGIGRKFAHILDTIVCFVGWFLPLFDAKRQTIADKVMATYVVEGVEKKPFSVNLWLPPKPQP